MAKVCKCPNCAAAVSPDIYSAFLTCPYCRVSFENEFASPATQKAYAQKQANKEKSMHPLAKKAEAEKVEKAKVTKEKKEKIAKEKPEDFLGKVWWRTKKVGTSHTFHVWSITMGTITILAATIMSLIMTLIPVSYATNLRINVSSIDTIEVTNTARGYNQRELSTSRHGDVQQDHINEIIRLFEAGLETNRFLQAFSGQESGSETLRNRDAHISNQGGVQRESVGLFIRINFALSGTQFVILQPDSRRQIFELEDYDTTNPRHLDSTRVASIYIPLGNVTNAFTQQTLHFGMLHRGNNINYALDTYANFYRLAKYVREIDNI
jgi:hypothetical protein